MYHRNTEEQEFVEKVVSINRVAKVVKGGKNFRFAILVVVGIEDAKKNLIEVPLIEGTIPHESIGIFGAGKVLLKPAPEGTGVIAGGPVRAVVELAGVKDIVSKSLGSANSKNMVSATIVALQQLKRADEVAKLRGKSVEELLG